MKHHLLSLLLTLLFLSFPASAFNEAVDSVGPLELRILGETKTSERRLPVELVLRNQGEASLQGTLRLEAVDDWRVDQTGEKAFVLEGKQDLKLPFKLTAGPKIYNAHYPVHAWVEFEVGGEAKEAHAILIVETRFSDPPQHHRPIPWQPIELMAPMAFPLWQSPIHRSFVQRYDDEKAILLPVAWQGSEVLSRADIRFAQEALRGQRKKAIFVHPPWAEGKSGSAVIEFPLILPQGVLTRFSFSTALADHFPERNEPASDGVTFRVRMVALDTPPGVLGHVYFERTTASKQWEDWQLDITQMSGNAVRLQLEVDPGPARNTACDRALWGEPTIILGDEGGVAGVEKKETPIDLGLLGASGWRAILMPGDQGLLNSDLVFQHPDQEDIVLQGFSVIVEGEALGSGVSRLEALDFSQDDQGATLITHRFKGVHASFTVIGKLWLQEEALRIAFSLHDAPDPEAWKVFHLEDVSPLRWAQAVKRVYAGVGNVIEGVENLSLSYDGHNLATSFVGLDFESGASLVQGVDVPPSRFQVKADAGHYALHAAHDQVWTLIPCSSVWTGAKQWGSMHPATAPAAFDRMAGRFVFDLWGGRYRESADALKQAMAYGLTDAAVVWHNWQRWGYDYRLPDIWPPNPILGSTEDFRYLAETCRDQGLLFIPHDNYIDIYPDAQDYSYEKIAFRADGRPIRAWYNKGRKAQAYRWRPDAIMPYVKRNLNLLQESIPASGYFIDVFSSIRPHDYWTHDGRYKDAPSTREAWGEVFSWIRERQGGDAPQISESGHDQMVGWIEGAQTNHLQAQPSTAENGGSFNWHVQCRDAERIPWIDMAHHHRYALHGAGYASRYAAGMSLKEHGMYSDDYIATEVLTGHPAMVSRPFDREVVRKYWLLHDFGRALAGRKMLDVQFEQDDIHRQIVSWEGGGKVWVNRGLEDWDIAGHRLPPYGFYALIPSEDGEVELAVERIDGIIAEWSRGPSGYYVNGRMPPKNAPEIRVEVAEMLTPEAGRVDLKLAWHAPESPGSGYRVFVHAIDKEGAIVFQGDHDPDPPTSAWQGSLETKTALYPPKELQNGSSLELHAGLYHPKTHRRIELKGRSEVSKSVCLGRFSFDKEEPTDFMTWEPAQEKDRKQDERENHKAIPVAFKGLRTAGGIRLTVKGVRLYSTPLPNAKSCSVTLDWQALPWTLPQPETIATLSLEGDVIHSEDLEQTETMQCYTQPADSRIRLGK